MCRQRRKHGLLVLVDQGEGAGREDGPGAMAGSKPDCISEVLPEQLGPSRVCAKPLWTWANTIYLKLRVISSRAAHKASSTSIVRGSVWRLSSLFSMALSGGSSSHAPKRNRLVMVSGGEADRARSRG